MSEKLMWFKAISSTGAFCQLMAKSKEDAMEKAKTYLTKGEVINAVPLLMRVEKNDNI